MKKLVKSFKNKIYNLTHKRKMSKKKFGSNFVIGFYTRKEIQNNLIFSILDPSYKKEFENFIYTKPEAEIQFGSIIYNENEPEFLSKLKETLEHLEKHNRPYNIYIYINNFQNLERSGILNIVKNINLQICNDFEKYTKDEFVEIQNKLKELILPIQKANLSPYEKYLAVYNLVKNYKEYQDNKDNPNESRELKYILNKEYTSMVCVGYAKLLKELLALIGIESKDIVVLVDSSYDNGFTKEEIPTKLEGHVRNLIKIDDDKYSIHGIYLSDPTWDNSNKLDLYNHHAITFNKLKEAYRLEALEDFDILLDFNNIDDFNKKINYLLAKKINNSEEKEINKKILSAYEELFTQIIDLIKYIDYQKYEYFIKKYQTEIEKANKQNNFNNTEKLFIDFINEYSEYIIPLSNNTIDVIKTIQALLTIKKEIDKYNETELEEFEKDTTNIIEKVEIKSFPYVYNPNETRDNYLESKPKQLVKQEKMNK